MFCRRFYLVYSFDFAFLLILPPPLVFLSMQHMARLAQAEKSPRISTQVQAMGTMRLESWGTFYKCCKLFYFVVLLERWDGSLRRPADNRRGATKQKSPWAATNIRPREQMLRQPGKTQLASSYFVLPLHTRFFLNLFFWNHSIFHFTDIATQSLLKKWYCILYSFENLTFTLLSSIWIPLQRTHGSFQANDM